MLLDAFPPEKHPFGASKKSVYLQIVSCFGCYFDKSLVVSVVNLINRKLFQLLF